MSTGTNENFAYNVDAPTPNKPMTYSTKYISADELEEYVKNLLDEVIFREGYLDYIENRFTTYSVKI